MKARAFATAVVALFVPAMIAHAQIPGVGGGTGAPFIKIDVPAPVTGLNAYEINIPPIFFDPDAPPVEKNLQAPAGGWEPGVVYTIHEWVTILPPPIPGYPNYPITDWHEHMLPEPTGAPAPFAWDVTTWEPMVSLDPSMGAPNVPGFSYMLGNEARDIWFFFDPLPVGPNGVTLHIWKDFQYLGQPGSMEPLRLVEYPTPSPSSLALLALGGIAARRRRG